MPDLKFDNRNRAQTAETTLEVLDAVSIEEDISQRGLADRLGIALGLTNAVLKRCIKKGLLKVHQAPMRRYAYYLTPKGFAEKSRLTAEYLSYSLKFYRTARKEFGDLIQYCDTRGWRRIVLVGATELAEIASLAAVGTEVEIVAVLAPGRNEAAFCALPIVQALEDIPADRRPNAVIIADTEDPQSAFDALIDTLPQERVLAPSFMRLAVRPPQPPKDQSAKEAAKPGKAG